MSIINRNFIKKNNDPYLILVFFKNSNKNTFIIDMITINNTNPEMVMFYGNKSDDINCNDTRIKFIEFDLDTINKISLIKSFSEKKLNIIVIYGNIVIEKKYNFPTNKFLYTGYNNENILVIPYSENNLNIIKFASELSGNIINNKNIIQIVLTLINKTLSDVIKVIDSKYYIEVDDKYIYENTIGLDYIKNPLLIDKTNYIFYPFIDIIDNPINEKTSIFNTKGFYYNSVDIFNKIYKRFSSKKNGLLLERSIFPIIPKIIHLIQVDPSKTNLAIQWGKIVCRPWNYELWNEDKILSMIELTRWSKIYNNSDQSIKSLVAKLAILELYGGIAVDSFVTPVKLFDDFLLSSSFFTAYSDTNYEDLLFNIIGSVKCLNLSMLSNTENKIDPARRPFVGKNNYFINLKENPTKIQEVNEDTNNSVIIFDKLYSALNNNVTISKLKNEIVKSKGFMIYPCYFFKKEYTIVETNIDPITKVNKSSLVRTFQTTPQSMIASLEDNPLNKFRIFDQEYIK